MPRLIVTIDGVTVRDVQLTRDRTTIGRRPYNDVVIDNLAVSGDHAAIERGPEGAVLLDLGSTNGTFLNGRLVQRAPLQHQDTIDIGKYRLRYVDELPTADFEKTMMVPSPLPGASTAPAPAPAPATSADAAAPPPTPTPAGSRPLPEAQAGPGPAPAPGPARVRVLSGGAAGRELPLVKVVTTIGRPGGAVAAITRRTSGYTLSHVEGSPPVRLNGTVLGQEPVILRPGDQLLLAGVEMEFLPG